MGLVAGLGLKDGAVASSVAHDSHNIIVVGDNDKYMHIAVEKLQAIEGGVVLVSQGAVVNFVSLPIAGLMSDRPLDEVKERLGDLIAAAYNGSPTISILMTYLFWLCRLYRS